MSLRASRVQHKPNDDEMPSIRRRGVALVAVLSILVVLALLAASLAVLMQIEGASARTHIGELQLYLLLDSSLAHARALIHATHAATPGQAAARDMLLERFAAPAPAATPWINVCDLRGNVCGRYAVTVEDDAAKVNLNCAFLRGPSPGDGWTTGELNLPLALGVPPPYADMLIAYRYGRNAVPGARGDDDNNNIFLMTDGIDNDADGVVDEDNEGVDDPGEYNAAAPCGDDRAFTGIAEALRVLRTGISHATPATLNAVRRDLPHRATLHSLDFPALHGDGTPARADINVVPPRACRRAVGRANQRQPFGATQRQLNQLAINIVDYRDQNHVLSTLGGQYGVEAVNFNEVLANDGTVAFNTAPATVPTATAAADALVMPHYCLWNHEGDAWQLDKARWAFTTSGNYAPWDIEVLDARRVRLLGPARKFTSPSASSYFMDAQRVQVFNRYLDLRRGTSFPPQRHTARRNGYSYTYEAPSWPDNLFKNAFVILVQSKPSSLSATAGNSPRVQQIRSSTRDGVLQLDTPITFDYTTNLTRGLVFGWAGRGYCMCAQPQVPLLLSVSSLQPHKYYLPVVNNWSEHRTPDRVARAGFAPLNKLWRDNRRPTDHKLIYGGDTSDNGELVRTSGKGLADVFYITGDDTTFSPALGYSGWNTLLGITFMRPEVLELINVSPRAISLRGWTLTFNSGSVVNDIGVITQARGYSLRAGGPDANPCIAPQGYFYLVNNIKLFNSEYGSGAPAITWGASAAQSVPVWEIPHSAWGVQYEIEKAVAVGSNPYDVRLQVRNESFRPNQFRGEVIECVNTLNPDQTKGCAHGCRYRVVENGRNTLTIDVNAADRADATHFEPGGYIGSGVGVDRAMLLGLPAKGGVVSMTLKNEYKQIVARTIDYAYLDQEPDQWYGRSAEKIDPTQYEWLVRTQPSIDGRPAQALNYTQRGRQQDPVNIKNGPFASVGEVQRVRAGGSFRNVGGTLNTSGQRAMLGALADTFGAASIRLEACDARARRTGWHTALDAVQSVRNGSITARTGAWEADQWKDHTLLFLSGALRGEKYYITGNTRTTLRLTDPGDRTIPRSTPGRRPLLPAADDVFCLGPGYSTPLCFTRRAGDKGQWLWKNRVAVPGTYQLYLFGLNDAINTSEFMEENFNATLDVFVWNWTRNAYDQLAHNCRYDKSDSIHAGAITPAHISPQGDLQLQLVAGDLGERQTQTQIGQLRQARTKRQTGWAWFNYAVITPVPLAGRINVNTAGVRLLRAMPGVSATLAANLADGAASASGQCLKPYRSFSELLRVKGMTPQLFERIANLLALRTSTYTIETRVQAVQDTNHDGVIDEDHGDKIMAARHMRYVARFHPGTTSNGTVQILERYAP